MKKVIIISIACIATVIVLAARYRPSRDVVPLPGISTPTSAVEDSFIQPLNDAVHRVTKKPFGIHITPTNSPVSPEKFTGYHTGVDFETYPGEQDEDIGVYAVCGGSLLQKTTATGYGGVVVQRCEFRGAPITVVYGHLRLTSVTINLGQQVWAGQKIGVLGAGFSKETDGERKHLHLGIHRGTILNIRGYVQSSAELSAWINIVDYLK